jgi:hypothetical protein
LMNFTVYAFRSEATKASGRSQPSRRPTPSLAPFTVVFQTGDSLTCRLPIRLTDRSPSARPISGCAGIRTRNAGLGESFAGLISHQTAFADRPVDSR